MGDKKKGRKNSKDPRVQHMDVASTDAASSTDFTGLIPANPQADGAMKSYKDIHGFGNDAGKRNRK